MNEHRLSQLCGIRTVVGLVLLFLLVIVPEAMARSEAPSDIYERVSFQTGEGTLIVRVFEDANQNQRLDGGEGGVAGVIVRVSVVENGVGTPIEQTTPADGVVEFTGLTPGNYQVEVAQLPDTHATLAGDERFPTVLAGMETEVFFPLTTLGAPEPQPTATQAATPTSAPSPTASPTPTVTNTPLPTDTPPPSPTAAQSPTATGTATNTPTTTPTPSVTATLFPITPILITTTPGVLVTTTPVPQAVDQLPDTGVGATPLLWAAGFGLLMLVAAGLRRVFRTP